MYLGTIYYNIQHLVIVNHYNFPNGGLIIVDAILLAIKYYALQLNESYSE